MGEPTKQVRVDNWGIFFLQRLQMFFSKTDYCDMTLQFEGNVQLKVHRLVMNACTEYFQFLEQTCALDDNVIMMPSDLQADVIVPIVNFMYTGMLEFQLSIFDKLYKTAQLMNITILTKLLDAQKQPMSGNVKSVKKKHVDSPHPFSLPGKKPPPKVAHHPDLPAPLPGRKLPVWKRKSIPTTSQPFTSHGSSQINYHEKYTPAIDPLSVPDNTPKPTRFEWPDDDLPPLNPMDTSFEEISYTSRPLLTQEEEQRATTSFDDIRHLPNANRAGVSSKKQTSTTGLDMEEMKNYVKEQKIRSGMSHDEEVADDEETGVKRKAGDQKVKGILKKVRFDENEGKTATISIAADVKTNDLNHEKIVTELLKKYPQLVKKNKNIRLKIMAKSKGGVESPKAENLLRTPRIKVTEVQKIESPKAAKPRESDSKSDSKSPWKCDRCSTDEDPVEFVLYYLYRKHMTDVHNEKFDPKLCKYCGHRCNKHNLLMYHLYTKHGMRPPPGYNFPKCDQCPYIALSANILGKHKLKHGKNEIQCVECKLAFTSQITLTSHIQITGHTGKSNKNNYDCQYCTKRFQSGVHLFSHVRMQHRNEALRDGIVSIDEMDDVEDFEEEEKDEYILPEIISDPESATMKKVNVLSNVKVPDRSDLRHQQLTLEPSSEAEALNNVASGIATSLGLVDIVVLNDNQQIFLQPNQQNFSSDQTDQPEFILPELTGRDSFTQGQGEVMTTDGVITQSMLSSGDIGSTDELVMVLTDHDYGDNQVEINNDNSNIVVLYSHPVDGQQEQFITSQGNLMVNSQGMLEIRNGATITSTANQVVMTTQESHIESIEMIQREIESHQDLKQETLYEEESKPTVSTVQKENSDVVKEATPPPNSSNPLIESLTQGEQLEFTSPLTTNSEEVNASEDIAEKDHQEVVANEEHEESHEKEENLQPNEEVKEGDETLAAPKEISSVEEQADTSDAMEIDQESEENLPTIDEIAAQVRSPDEEEKDTENVHDSDDGSQMQVVEHAEEEEEETPKSITTDKPSEESEAPPAKELETPAEPTEPVPTPPEPEAEVQSDKPEENLTPPADEKDESRGGESSVPDDNSTKTDLMEIDEDLNEESAENDKNQEEETNREHDLSQSDTSTSQFNDENSQSSQDSHKEQGENISTKISILDDWEDTDSQQSDPKEKAKVAGEAVHKLMDDWEEEEEDECRKEIAG